MVDKRKNIVVRFGIVYITILLLFLLVVYKIVEIQFFEREEWMKLAERQKRTDITVKPKRGNIYAYDGRLLASSIPTYYVYMDMRVPALQQNDGELFYSHLDELSVALSQFFGERTPDAYKRMLLTGYRERRGELLLHPRRISYSQLKDLRTLPLFKLGRNRSGLFEREFVRRVKPFGSLASRTIGDVYADEVKGGRSGLEGSFNDQLVGVPGVSTRQKMANKYIETIEVEPVDGLDIYSTIDIDLQDIAEKALRDTIGALGARSGLVVLMEVKTGEIKAMVNLDRDEQTGTYFEGANHALTAMTEPGSTFKIASLMAVLDEGKVKLTDRVETGNGKMQISTRIMRDHNHERGGYGVLTVDEVIHVSSNVGISKLVMETFGSRPEKFIEKLYDFRLNDSLPIQMKGVAKPWIKHPIKNKKDWYATSLAWISIGYETKIPPIYTLTFFNAIANGGKMVKPLFVKEIRRNDQVVESFQTEVLKSSLCKATTLRDVQQSLLGVVEGDKATAKNVKSNIVSIAGKTGTAQISQGSLGYRTGQTRHNVSFCGYFPAEDPVYSCIVVITAPEGLPSGGRMAGAIFKKVAERTMLSKSSWTPETIANDTIHSHPFLPQVKHGNYAALQQVAQQLTLPVKVQQIGWVGYSEVRDNRIEIAEFKTNSGQVPDVRGMAARDAFYILGNAGFEVLLSGRGKVISQSISPGTAYADGTKIELFLQ